MAALPTPEEFKNATIAITEVEATIDEAKLRLLLLQKDLEERKALLAPIRKLPAEILSEIFILMSEMEHLAPVTITEVCGLWRTVVLSTPRAWSLIYASAPEHDKHLVQYVSTFIERSHPCLLHIWVPDTNIHEEEEEYEYKSETDATISLFLPYLSRIECLSVAGWQLAMLRQESMPNLTRLKIYGHTATIPPLFASLSQFPCLESIDSPLSTWAKPLSHAWFPPLHYLTLEGDINSVWIDVIQNCASTLKALSLRIHYGFQQAPTITITFPRLESFSISGWSNRTTLTWPVRMITPILLSNEFARHAALARLLHRDVKSVIYLRSDLVLDPDCYVNLREFRLRASNAFTATMLAVRLAQELERHPNACPELRVTKIEVLGYDESYELTNLVKSDIVETIRSARRDLEVLFTYQYKPMPTSVRESSCSSHMPCSNDVDCY